MDTKYWKSDNPPMAWLKPTEPFDPDAFPAKVVGYASSLGDHDSGLHQHARGQLLYARQGCIRITLAQQLCLLPPSRAAWIPPRTPHRAVMRKVVDYRSVWFDAELTRKLPADVRVIEVSSLLEAVLEPMAMAEFDLDWTQSPYEHLIGLSMHEIGHAPRQPMLLPMPQDRRLATLTAHPDVLPPELGELSSHVGATGKTIGRIFQRDTGMSYQEWRQQWRVLRAIELLVTGHAVSHITSQLGFSTDSSFITFFKHMQGCAPGAYMKKARGGNQSR
jgi:AraC-like DNA-binding protein